MMDDWSRTAEQIMLSTIENRIRVLAITSAAPGVGVSSVARTLAATFARAGRKTLLLDLSASAGAAPLAATWRPDRPLATNALVVTAQGLATLAVQPTAESHALFTNVDLVRGAFARDFSEYSALVLDLPPIGAASLSAGILNATALARAAEAVFMVAPTGRTSRDAIAEAALSLRQVGAPLAGVIMNDQHCTTLGAAIASTVRARLGRLFPALAARIAHRALASRYLAQNFRIAG